MIVARLQCLLVDQSVSQEGNGHAKRVEAEVLFLFLEVTEGLGPVGDVISEVSLNSAARFNERVAFLGRKWRQNWDCRRVLEHLDCL